MEKDAYQVSLKVVLKNEEGKTLVLKVKEDDVTGLWDLPGGRIGKDEFEVPLSQIIHREFEEEVGPIEYTLDEQPKALGKFKNIDSGVNILYIIFEGSYINGEITISEGHEGFDWVNLDDANLSNLFSDGLLEAVTNYTE